MQCSLTKYQKKICSNVHPPRQSDDFRVCAARGYLTSTWKVYGTSEISPKFHYRASHSAKFVNHYFLCACGCDRFCTICMRHIVMLPCQITLYAMMFIVKVFKWNSLRYRSIGKRVNSRKQRYIYRLGLRICMNRISILTIGIRCSIFGL